MMRQNTTWQATFMQSIFIIAMIALCVPSVFAATPEINVNSSSITLGQSILTQYSVYTAYTPSTYTVNLYTASGTHLATLDSGFSNLNLFTGSHTITQADYLTTGTFIVRINASDAAGDALSAQTTFTVNPAPDTTPPTITSVTNSSPVCNVIRFTINGAADNVALHATPYSFDAGATWQSNNYMDHTGTTHTMPANHIQVRDAALNIYSYPVSITGTANTCPDTTSPVIVINQPITKEYNTSIVPVQLTCTDNIAVDKIWYNINGGANTFYTTTTSTTLADGSYTINAFCNDTSSNNASASRTFSINTTVTPPNVNVSFNVSATPISGVEPLSVQFTISNLNGNAPYTYNWNFGDGQTSTANNPLHTYIQNSSYTANVTITDTDGDKLTKTIAITVTDTSPVVDFTWSPTSPIINQIISFLSSASAYDGIASYSWSFGDSTTSTTSNPTHSYSTIGSKTITLTVTDGDGSTATATHSLIIITAPDTTSPVIVINRPLAQVYNITTIPINLTCTDNIAVSRIWYNINNGANTTYTTTTTTILADGTYTIRAFCNDTSNNNASASRTFSINTTVTPPADTTPPVIVINRPLAQVYNITTIPINLTCTDNIAVSRIWYNINNGANTTYTTTTTTILADGTYTIRAFCNDTSNNNASASRIFSINTTVPADTTLPTITSVTNSSPLCNTIRFTINGAADNVALHATPYSFDAGATWQAANFLDFAGITHTIPANNIRVRDAALNVYIYPSSITGTANACADPTAPNITINQPLSINYNTTTVPVRITCTDNVAVSAIWYNINGGVNTAYTTPSAITLPDNRSYTIFAFCNDTSNNIATASTFFSIYSNQTNGTTPINDTSAPNITINQPLAQTYNTTTVPVQITCIDNYALDKIWYNFGAANISYNTITTATLADNTTYTMTAYCNDTMSNTASTTRIFNINTSFNNGTPINDTSAPNITINQPLQQNYNATIIPVQITCTDNIAVSTIWYNMGGANVTYNTTTTFTAAQNTSYLMTAYCNDTSGNLATAIRTFSTFTNQSNGTPVVDTPPVIVINQPLSINYNTTTVPVRITCTDSIGVSSIWYNINNGINSTYTTPTTITLTDNRSYTIFAFCNDTINNIATASTFFSIYSNQTNGTTPINDTSAPNITINQPLQQNYNATIIPVQITCTDNYALDSIWYNMGGVNISYNTPTTFTATQNTTYLMTAYCNDTMSNTASATRTFSTFTNQSNGTPVVDPAPNITINQPLQQNYNTTTVPIQITCTDNIGVSTIWYNLNNGVNITYVGITNTTLPDNTTNVLYAYCNDTINNVASATRLFTINTSAINGTPVNDTTLPIIVINQPLAQNYNITTVPVQITCTDNLAVSTIWYNFNNGANVTYSGIASATLADNTTYTMTAYCNDTAGNRVSTTRIFSIFSNQTNGTPVIDIIPPNITINQPLQQNYNATIIPVQITCTDNIAVSTIWYNMGGANVTYNTTTTFTAAQNTSYLMTAYCNDTSGNLATAIRTFSTFTNQSNGTPVVDTPPVIVINQPLAQNYNATVVPLQITCTDNLPYTSIWYNINNGPNVVYTIPTTLNVAINQTYNIIAYCNDSINNIVNATRTFSTFSNQSNGTPVVDITPPVIVINQPLPVNYNTTTVPVQITCTDNVAVSAVWYNFNNGVNVTYNGITSTTLSDNTTYNMIAFCNDTSGNLANATRTFSINTSAANGTPVIDIIVPTIIIIQPLQQNYNATSIPVQITCTDNAAISSIWYNINGINYNYTGATFLPVASNQTYFMRAYCNDTTNNIATANVTFSTFTNQSNGTPVVDILAPFVNITAPTQQNYNATILPLNITCSDNLGVSSIWYNLNGTNITYNSPTTITVVSNQTYWLKAYCNDTSGNIGTANVTFSTFTNQSNGTPVVDIMPPILTVHQPLTQTYSSTTVPVNITCIDNLGVSSIWYNINGGVKIIYTTPTTITLANGQTYAFNAYCNDTSNNTASVTRTVTINTGNNGGGGGSGGGGGGGGFISCISNYTCDSWSSCANSTQSRFCTDTKKCDLRNFTKTESRSCSASSTTGTTGTGTINISTDDGSIYGPASNRIRVKKLGESNETQETANAGGFLDVILPFKAIGYAIMEVGPAKSMWLGLLLLLIIGVLWFMWFLLGKRRKKNK